VAYWIEGIGHSRISTDPTGNQTQNLQSCGAVSFLMWWEESFIQVCSCEAYAGQEQGVQKPLEQPPSTATSVGRPDSTGSKHWPAPSNRQLQYHAYSARGVMCEETVKCHKCGVELCVTRSCFLGLSHQGTILF
jgi:hypothetical protein